MPIINTDGTEIGRIGDRLKVDINSEVSAIVGCPVISPKLRYDFDDSGVTISTTFVNLFSFSGSGKLFGFVLDFNQSDIQVKLTIDSTDVIFDLTGSQLKDIQVPAAGGQAFGVFGIVWEVAGNRLRFEPTCSIPFESKVEMEGKRTGGADRSMDRSLVALTKET